MNSSSESMFVAVEAGVAEGLFFWPSELTGLALSVVSVSVADDSLLCKRRWSENAEVAFREPWAAFGSGSSLSVIAASAAFLFRVTGVVVNKGAANICRQRKRNMK